MKGQESQTGAGVPGRPLTLKPLRWPGFQGHPYPHLSNGALFLPVTVHMQDYQGLKEHWSLVSGAVEDGRIFAFGDILPYGEMKRYLRINR